MLHDVAGSRDRYERVLRAIGAVDPTGLVAIGCPYDEYSPEVDRLIPLVPSVIGLSSDDVRVDATVALRSALAALPIVPAPRQQVLATAILACELALAELDGRDLGSLSPLTGGNS